MANTKNIVNVNAQNCAQAVLSTAWLYVHVLAVFFSLFIQANFPGQTPVPSRSGTWIFELLHDPIWAIWLAEVSKFHQRRDGIDYLMLPRSKQTQRWFSTYSTDWLIRIHTINFTHFKPYKSTVINPKLQAAYLESTLINTFNGPRLSYYTKQLLIFANIKT